MFRSPDTFRDATLGGVIGAVLGLLLVTTLIALNYSFGRDADDISELMPWLGVLGFVIVSQFAMAGGLYGLAVAEPTNAR